jgi:UDP-glucose 4-epimerase
MQRVEFMVRDFELAYGLRSVALRYFNAAEARIGERHDPEVGKNQAAL